ncbi:MAG: ABC transporter ATP-binding protein [Herpetosiphonaceae bacterium]|nr:ABC transporter ATP-binding protein [Herpetosiphonaceae bacterium]
MKAQAGQYRALLIAYLRPQWRSVVCLAVVLLSSIALQLVNPQLLRHFIDTVRAGGSLDTLNRTALLFIAVVVLSQLVAITTTYLSERVAWNATNRLREDLTLHCLRLPLSFHNVHTPGELIQRVDGDVDALTNLFSQFVVRILGNGLLLVGVLLIVLREEWHIGLLLSAFATLAVVVLLRMKRVAVPFFKAHRQAFAELTGFWEERITGTEDLRANGAIPYTMRRHYALLDAHVHKARIGNVMGRVMQSTAEMLLALGTAGAVAVGAYVLKGGAITLGTLYLVLAYTNLIAWNLLEITMQLDDLQKAVGATERIIELYHTPNLLQSAASIDVPVGPPSVVFDHVSFGYTADVPVLNDISFCLKPGTVLGLLGRTGSGKTTLTRLLFRFYDVAQGTLRFNDIDIRDLPPEELRRRMGVVTQDVQLFHATVRDNLTLFDDSITDERIYAAIHQLDLDSWLASLPQRLDTELAGDGGLSAGEAQLLACTRVFLQNPDLVILDEASSRLDPATERRISRAVERLLGSGSTRRTAIIIAHRLQTVQHVDEILILDHGRIQEYGAPSELLNNPASRFSQLLRTGLELELA